MHFHSSDTLVTHMRFGHISDAYFMDYTTRTDKVKGNPQILSDGPITIGPITADNRCSTGNRPITAGHYMSKVCPYGYGKIAGNFASDNQSPITPLATFSNNRTRSLQVAAVAVV